MAEVPVRLHPGAEEDANNARAWYAERSPTAADAFLAELDAAMFSISEAPKRWLRTNRKYRRFPMHRFPFNVVYVERPGFIEVMALAHFRRKPGYTLANFVPSNNHSTRRMRRLSRGLHPHKLPNIKRGLSA